ncbi:WD40 repeat domain-containing protein [Chloropicon primus]|nr:WD40 repeat domain-containing protein [Chloropicon primus]
MDMLPYVDSLIKEYFLFRGFTSSYHAFELDSSSDKSKVFNVEECASLLLDTFLPNFQSKRMVSLCQFLESNIFSKLEPELQQAFKRLTASLYKKYLVNAITNKRVDKVTELFDHVAGRLRQQPEEWSPWFSIQYVKNPEKHPDFELYFTADWASNLRVSLQNLLSRAFHKVPLPSILRFHLDRLYRRNLQLRIEALQVEKTRLETLLSIQNGDEGGVVARHQPLQTKAPVANGSHKGGGEAMETQGLVGLNNGQVLHVDKKDGHDALEVQLENLPTDLFDALSDGGRSEETADNKSPTARTPTTLASSPSPSTVKSAENEDENTFGGEELSKLEPARQPSPPLSEETATEVEAEAEGKGPETLEANALELELVSDFEGHEAPITCCRCSPDGENVASSSSNGTVRIWSADDAPSTRNVTIRCSCNVLCLEWEPRRKKLVLLGTSMGTVKGWNVDSKRFVFDVEIHKELTDVISVKCSPSDTVFAVIASTKERGEGRRGSLSLWNSRSFSKIGNLTLGKEEDLDSPVNCVAFSHTGRTVAAGSVDGMVSMYDCASRSAVAGFPVSGDASIADLKFGKNDESLWTLSTEGKVQEWKLSTSELLREVDLLKYQRDACVSMVNEIVVDSSGSFLAATLGKSGIILELGADSQSTAVVETDLDSVVSMDWRPNSTEVVAGSDAATVIHIYNVLS